MLLSISSFRPVVQVLGSRHWQVCYSGVAED